MPSNPTIGVLIVLLLASFLQQTCMSATAAADDGQNQQQGEDDNGDKQAENPGSTTGGDDPNGGNTDDDGQLNNGDDKNADNNDDDNDGGNTEGDNKNGGGNNAGKQQQQNDDDDNNNDDGDQKKDDNDDGNQNKDDDDNDDNNDKGDDDDDANDKNNDDDSGYASGSTDNDGGAAGSKTGQWPYHFRLRCQDENGDYRPLATACENELEPEICELMFPSNKHEPHKRPRKCDLLGVNILAYKCAKHCKICCELAAHGCGDDPSQKVNCMALKYDCGKEHQVIKNISEVACAGTCGTCNKGSCRDNIPGCIAFRSVCKNPHLRDDLHRGCERTCGFCDPLCHDKGLDCKEGRRRGDCKSRIKRIRDEMRDLCPAACGVCSPRSPDVLNPMGAHYNPHPFNTMLNMNV